MSAMLYTRTCRLACMPPCASVALVRSDTLCLIRSILPGAGAFSEAAWCLLELRRASEGAGASASCGAVEQRGSLLAEVAPLRSLLCQGAAWAVGLTEAGTNACCCVRDGTAQRWLRARPVPEPHRCCGAVHHLVSGRCLVHAWWVAVAAASCGWRRQDSLPAAPSLSTGLNVGAWQALAVEVAAQVTIEGFPTGGALRVARPSALGDVWKALDIADLLPAQLQVRAARCGWHACMVMR